MIKFIDFCEMWFLPESEARVAIIVRDYRCHTPRHRFKETLDAFLACSRPISCHTSPKLIWEAIQCGDRRRTFGQCVARVVAHYPDEICLWPSPGRKEGQLAQKPRRSSAGCLKYRQCVLEECESDIQYRLIP
ncbi:uncharacterized protein TNCV_4076661 [Trichonephila clavipes]|nr:uncharacterized protein TNCV_4076661 [Trichonephila clavipes]